MTSAEPSPFQTPGAAKPTAENSAPADFRERHIPVRYRVLADELNKRFCLKSADGLYSFVEDDVKRLRELSGLIAEIIRQETDGLRESLVEKYEGLNPDRDTLERFGDATPGETAHFLNEVGYIFDRAGFRPVGSKTFQHALDTVNVSGVEVGVDFSKIEFLLMFERGRSHRDVPTPGFMGLYERMVHVECVSRLGVVLKMKDQPGIFVKMFKDIPIPDLEAVLPGAAVRMSHTDKVWLGITIGSALFAIAGVMLDSFFGLFTDGGAAEKILTGVLVAAGGAAYKVYYSYSVLKDSATGRLNKQLYYQQLDGNAGVISLLLEMVSQQEAKVALASYLMLLRTEEPVESVDKLDRMIEKLLTDRFGKDINFDMPTAVDALKRLGLWAGGDRPSVVSLETALGRLHEHAAARRTADHHVKAGAAGNAEAAVLHRLGVAGKSLA